MSEFLILKKRRDFLRAAKDLTVIFHNVMLQAARPLSGIEHPARIGFTATKRLGKANVRNRTKRRLRAVVREIYGKYALDNVDYVLVARYDTYNCPFKDLRRDMIWALKKINKMITEENQAKSGNEEGTACYVQEDCCVTD